MSILIGNQAAVFVEGPHLARVIRFTFGRDSDFFDPDSYKKYKDDPQVREKVERFFNCIDQVAMFVNSRLAYKFYYTGCPTYIPDLDVKCARTQFGYQICWVPGRWRGIEAGNLAKQPESVSCIIFGGSLGFSSESILLAPIEDALAKGKRRLVYITAKELFVNDRKSWQYIKRNNIEEMVRLLLQHNGGLFFFDCGEYLSGNKLAKEAASWDYNI